MLSIVDLDDDCLITIFDFLSIYELIEAEKVCKTFKSTCENVYDGKRFHKMKIGLAQLKTEYFEDIFDRIGKSLRAFEFSGGYIMNEDVKQTMIDGITQSCPKLKSLTINYVQFSDKSFHQLQKSFSNLTYLDLSRCNLNESTLGVTLDGDLCGGIKVLKLAGNSELKGSFFKNMSRVESLDISYCFNLSYFEFLKFLRNCERLLDLDVSASCQLVSEDENFLKVILTYQPNLERLNMDKTGITGDAEVLSQFKSLKFASFEGRKFGI